MSQCCRIRPGAHIGNDHQRTPGQRRLTARLSGSDTTGLVPIIHTAFTSPRPMAANSSTAVSPGVCASRSVPRNARGAADPAAQNSYGRPASLPAPPPRGRPSHLAVRSAKTARSPNGRISHRPVDVNNGITLVAAAGRLIDSHGVERYRSRRGDEIAIEPGDLLHLQPAEFGHLRRIPGCGGGQRLRLVAKIARQRVGLGNRPQ